MSNESAKSSARVVNLRAEEFDIYIGRPRRNQFWRWGNPMKLEEAERRARVRGGEVVIRMACPGCGHHHRVHATETSRAEILAKEIVIACECGTVTPSGRRISRS